MFKLRYNTELGVTAPYYRLKESYRDIRGNVHSLIVLNIGFEPTIAPDRMRRIAASLTERFKNRKQPSLFSPSPDGLNEAERKPISTGNG